MVREERRAAPGHQANKAPTGTPTACAEPGRHWPLAAARALICAGPARPWHLADATLVALAESLNGPRIFTLDADFAVYRFKGRQMFRRVP